MRRLIYITVVLGAAASLTHAAMPFPETITPEMIRSHYQTSAARVLIVPGHDVQSGTGAVYRGVREVDINMEIGNALAGFFSADTKFDTLLVRDATGYAPFLTRYFADHYSEILAFQEEMERLTENYTAAGAITRDQSVDHLAAPADYGLRLFGINHWANHNGADLLLHLHFNDDAGRMSGQPGAFSGFTIYVPEHQLPNSRASMAIAPSVLARLQKVIPVSDAPHEQGGIVEDQDLIAVGEYATLQVPSLLIEYSYIYEPQIASEAVRKLAVKELAYQTYLGVKSYFDPDAAAKMAPSAIIPYIWNGSLRRGMKASPDVFALQRALELKGFYPPKGYDLSDCPLTGNFGSCTQAAVTAFQKQNGIDQTGLAGPLTINALGK